MTYKVHNIDDLNEQYQYVLKHRDRIIELILLSYDNQFDNYSSMIKYFWKYIKDNNYKNFINHMKKNYNDANEIIIKKYGKIIYKLDKNIVKFSKLYPFYFVKDGEKIIGFCMMMDEELFHICESMKPYTVYDKSIWEKLEPLSCNEQILNAKNVLTYLCKDPKYKNIGILLFNHLKNNYKTYYLVSESLRNLNFIDKFKDSNDCNVYDKKYYKNNMKLIKYYKKMGFKLVKDTYYVNDCNDGVILLNVHKMQ